MFYHESIYQKELNNLAKNPRILIWPLKNFHVRLMKDVAVELQNLILEATEGDLLFLVTKRFYDSIDPYFREGLVYEGGQLLPGPLIPPSKFSKDFYKKIIFYLHRISTYLYAAQKGILAKIDDDVKAYYLKYSSLENSSSKLNQHGM